jgi:ribosome biogenesis protein MAK21
MDDFDLDDEEAFVDSDDEIPVDLAMDDDTDIDEAAPSKSANATERDNRKAKKRKLKNLPTFASADDYAKLLGGDDSE